MKNYEFNIQKLSKSADIKIKTKLYFLIFKKKFINLFSIKNFKFIFPVLVLSIFIFGFLNNSILIKNQNWNNIEISKIQQNKNYLEISNKRVLKAKIAYYKKYSNLRKIKSLASK